MTVIARCMVPKPGDTFWVGSTSNHCQVLRDGSWEKGDGSEAGHYRALPVHFSNGQDVWDVWPPQVEMKRVSTADPSNGARWEVSEDTSTRFFSYYELKGFNPNA